jgi:hypothetical protein
MYKGLKCQKSRQLTKKLNNEKHFKHGGKVAPNFFIILNLVTYFESVLKP